jgi:hypothetical protein
LGFFGPICWPLTPLLLPTPPPEPPALGAPPVPAVPVAVALAATPGFVALAGAVPAGCAGVFAAARAAVRPSSRPSG